jgi:hypothetical protein
MSQLIAYLLGTLGGGSAVLIMGVALLLLHPEKVDKWCALLWRLLTAFGTLFRGAHKQYVRRDLQGRINEFARGLAKDAPFLASTRVQIEWTDEDITRKGFLEDGNVILRLKRNDTDQTNFVHGAYMFVSTSLLAKAKRYIAPSQRQSLDLYITTDLLEREKPSVLGLFLDAYLHPATAKADSKVTRYVDSFTKMDEAGLFKSVMLQELNYLGDKVFGRRQDDRIISEVDDLIEFLELVAGRRIGEESDLDFARDYCRFAIMIVGKPAKVSAVGHTPYVDYVRNHLIPRRIETLYVLGLWENKELLDFICQRLDEPYEKVRTRRSKVVLRYDDQWTQCDQYLIILRMRGVRILQASPPQFAPH